MILSDFDLDNMIRSKRLVIMPLDGEMIRENGVDMRLADEVGRHNPKMKGKLIDPTNEDHVNNKYVIEKNQKEIVIHAHEQILATTEEYIKMPDNLMSFVELRSTWARHGLMLPPTIIDAGFEGNVTLEIFNSSPNDILLKPGMRLAHMIFALTLSRVEHGYSGKYNGQRGVKTPKVIKTNGTLDKKTPSLSHDR